MFKHLAALFIASCLFGCTSVRVLEKPSAETMHQKLAVGDEAVITTDTGKRYELRITALKEDALLGRDADNQQYKVHFNAIQSVEHRSISVGKTTGAAGSMGATYLVYLMLSSLAIGLTFDDAFCFSDDD